MKLTLLMLLASVAFSQARPNPYMTPGLARQLSKHTICTTHWDRDVRHVSEIMKKQVCVNYGIVSGCPGSAWEIDHLIPRELGGADDVRNLWPQPIAQARVKDVLENQGHKDYCAGRITLKQAQEGVKRWWAKP